jgi:hypothetical protein
MTYISNSRLPRVYVKVSTLHVVVAIPIGVIKHHAIEELTGLGGSQIEFRRDIRPDCIRRNDMHDLDILSGFESGHLPRNRGNSR